MKTIMKFLAVSGFLIGSAMVSNAQVHIFIGARPVEPVVVRPAVMPYRDAVWIPGEWSWAGDHYAYVNPHYEHAHPGHVWVRGHWNDSRRGHAWVGGHWR